MKTNQPLVKEVEKFDRFLIKIMTLEFLRGHFNLRHDVLQLMIYFSQSIHFQTKFVPDPANQLFDIETEFSCRGVWTFGYKP